MESQLNQEQIENIKQILRDINISNTNQSLIQDNKIYFSHDGKSYRCEMPDQIQQVEAEDFKDIYKMENMKKFPMEVQLRKQWKENGVDIEEMEKERQKIRDEYQFQAITGASILSHEKEKLTKHYKVMEELEEKLMQILIQIEEHLSTSLEKKVLRQYYRKLASLCCQKRNEKGEWISAWNNFDEFEKDKSTLPYKAIARIQSLLLQTRE